MSSLKSSPKRETLLIFFKRSPLSVKLKLIALGGLALAVLITSVRLVVGILGSASEQKESLASVVPGPQLSSPSFAISYALKDLSLSLESRSGGKVSYVQFTLLLDLPSVESQRWMQLNHAKLLDTLTEVGRGFHIEDFTNPSGFRRFKDRLVAVYSEKFGRLAPREIAFKDWILH